MKEITLIYKTIKQHLKLSILVTNLLSKLTVAGIQTMRMN